MAADFWTSSHCHKWLLDDEDALRKCSNAKDLEKIFTSENGFDDIQRLRLHFVEWLHLLGRKMNLHQRVISTSVVYFKRFYCKKSFYEFDPRLVAPTMLFLASKSEECAKASHKIMAKCKEIDNAYRYNAEHIEECEFYCLEVLDFDLVVFHPYRPLTKYLMDCNMQQSIQTAWEIVNDSYRTDLCLLYPPYMIAIACVHMTASFHKKDCKQWLKALQVDQREVLLIVQEILLYYEQTNRSGAETDTDRSKVQKLLGQLDSVYQNKPVR
eukprot:205321_1